MFQGAASPPHWGPRYGERRDETSIRGLAADRE